MGSPSERKTEKKKSNVEAPECRDCSWRHEGGQLDEGNDALLILENKPTMLQSQTTIKCFGFFLNTHAV